MIIAHILKPYYLLSSHNMVTSLKFLTSNPGRWGYFNLGGKALNVATLGNTVYRGGLCLPGTQGSPRRGHVRQLLALSCTRPIRP